MALSLYRESRHPQTLGDITYITLTPKRTTRTDSLALTAPERSIEIPDTN